MVMYVNGAERPACVLHLACDWLLSSLQSPREKHQRYCVQNYMPCKLLICHLMYLHFGLV